MIRGIQPTSKAALKMQCLFAARGDIDEARRLYAFFAEDMESLPDYDPAPVTWADATRQTASGIFSWISQNRDTLATSYEVVRQMTGGRLPPLTLPSAEPAVPAADPLPEINA